MTINKAIQGKWLLLGSGGGFTGEWHPNNRYNGMIIQYGTVRGFSNDTLFEAHPYKLIKEATIYSATPEWTMDGLVIRISVSGDTLSLSDNHVEPYGSSYKRIASH